jgi:hypothetical protein
MYSCLHSFTLNINMSKGHTQLRVGTQPQTNHTDDTNTSHKSQN